ncbi:MAG: response regulator [Cyclobacteriaceae bacterium]|nr:response regulator [Cyclobacteriaceae bacterium]MCH8515065.1 response regulator [Cyclobacteriaceae bacterium]
MKVTINLEIQHHPPSEAISDLLEIGALHLFVPELGYLRYFQGEYTLYAIQNSAIGECKWSNRVSIEPIKGQNNLYRFVGIDALPEEKKTLIGFDVSDKLSEGASYILFLPDSEHTIQYDQHFKLIKKLGKRLIAEVNEKNKAKPQSLEIKDEIRLQKMLLSIASTYIDLDLDLVDFITKKSIAEIGRFVDADRAYYIEYQADKKSLNTLHEWCSEGIDSYRLRFQDLKIDASSPVLQAHLAGNPYQFIIDGQNLLRSNVEPALMFRPEDVKSFITVPLFDDHDVYGFVGFDAVKDNREFKDRERKVLFVLAQMLLNTKKQKSRELKLKLEEEKYRNILSNVNLGLVEVDNSGKIIYNNRAFQQMLSLDLVRLKEDGIKAIYAESLDFNTEIARKVDELKPATFQLNFERGTQRKWWLVSTTPNYDDLGRVKGALMVHFDISEQKLLELELEKARDTAEQSSKAKELFLASMSHEIRTPLNGIIGMLREVNKAHQLTEKKEYVNNALSASKHLLTILNNILDISKISAGELTLQEEIFQIADVEASLRAIFEYEAKKNQNEFKIFTPDSQSPFLKGDLLRLKQVLFNLIGNAIKYTKNGFVKLEICLLEATEKMSIFNFIIEDNGIGMSESYLDNIFAQFNRDDTRQKVHDIEGTGLGLTISRELVQLMGGDDIYVESKLNEGTKIGFVLSFENISSHQIKDQIQLRDAETDYLMNKNILIVEDNEMNRFIAIQILKEHGCMLHTAEDGREAVALCENNNYDLILMDIKMPILDGVGATKIIRNELGKNMPILAVTANVFKEDINRYLSAGMNGYITKPYDEDFFVRKVKASMQGESMSTMPKASEFDASIEINAYYSLETLEKISRGDADFMKRMIKIFVEGSEKNLDELKNGLAQMDIKKIKATAHRMKPSIDQLKIQKVQPLIRKLEALNEDLSPDSKIDIEKMIHEVESCLLQVSEGLKKELLSR